MCTLFVCFPRNFVNAIEKKKKTKCYTALVIVVLLPMFLESNLFIFNLTTTKWNIYRAYVNMSIKEVIESMTVDR